MTEEQLRSIGVILVVEASDGFALSLDPLEATQGRKNPQPRWRLLTVLPATVSAAQRAVIWVRDDFRPQFLKLFEDYLNVETKTGKPKNNPLVANIEQIRLAILDDLWQSDGEPPKIGRTWWELWLRRSDDGVELVRSYGRAIGARVSDNVIVLNDRTVMWLACAWGDMVSLPFTAVPVAELRRPDFVDTVDDLPLADQAELAIDLTGRVSPAPDDAPAVCHLDSGVLPTHVLLRDSLALADVHTLFANSADRRNHGTKMAGIALYGDLRSILLSAAPVHLSHRLESVKILPDAGQAPHDPLTYGMVTAQAVALPEITADRPRVFCLPVTAEPDGAPGEPTLWSASVDALAVGVDIAVSGSTLQLLSDPDPGSTRLFVVSAGNIPQSVHRSAHPAPYLDACGLEAIHDPAQAWNALTVGAFTDMIDVPSEPSFHGWAALAPQGELSPHSTTSQLFARAWPIKPDLCMEGGNYLADGNGDFNSDHPVVGMSTVDGGGDQRLGSANATSAAAAQAARLAAIVMARYPSLWPETVRGLLTHSARWTPAMRAQFQTDSSKSHQLAMLRRYGWGVPTEATVLTSTDSAVTMIIQDEFVPFEGREHAVRAFRLHRLPWPADALRELGSAKVTMRVTLSYFVEPTASRRGWQRRYSYASHGLRFDLKAPLESVAAFVDRINRTAADEESGARAQSGSDRWLIGPNQ